MRPTLKHLATRLLRKLYTLFPWLDGPWIRQIEVGYEKAGMVVRGEPIPWNADAVLIEAQVWFPHRALPRSEFALELPGEPPHLPVAQQAVVGEDGAISLLFRMPVPQQPCRVGIFWRTDFLAHVSLRTLSREAFLSDLRVESPTLFARLGEQNIACEALVDGQSQVLTSAVLLRSATSLLPILDLGPALEVTPSHSGKTHALPIPLTSGQLLRREAMTSVNLPAWLHAEEGARLRWTIAGEVYAQSGLRAIRGDSFRKSLVCVDCRYVIANSQGDVNSSRYLLLRDDVAQLGPCFVIASREPGVAAIHPFVLRIQYRDGERHPEYVQHDVLITDGPSLFIPVMMGPEEFQRIASFDLFSEGEHLGQLSLGTRDTATFTSEGGFTAPEDYPWTPTAEEELADHLRKLMEVPRAG